MLERRDHIGGNAYDRLDEAGVLIHQYGPHIFHTNDEAVFRYLCRFTRWRDYQHRVVADLPAPDGGRMQMPVPFNLTSLRKAFGPEEGKRLGEKLIAAYGAEKKVTILEMLPEVATDEMHLTRDALLDRLNEHATVITKARCTGITANGVTYVDGDGNEQTVACDHVVLSAGMRPRQDLAESFRNTAPFFVVIGDASKPSNVRNATRTGYDAALRL